MQDHIRRIVLGCCADHNDTSDTTIDLAREDAAPLFGVDGVLDSIALVTLIVAVEQAIEDDLDVVVTLADARAASEQHSPFRTVASLVAYATARVEEEQAPHA